MPDRSSPRELPRGCGQERRFLVVSLSGFEGHSLGAMQVIKWALVGY